MNRSTKLLFAQVDGANLAFSGAKPRDSLIFSVREGAAPQQRPGLNIVVENGVERRFVRRSKAGTPRSCVSNGAPNAETPMDFAFSTSMGLRQPEKSTPGSEARPERGREVRARDGEGGAWSVWSTPTAPVCRAACRGVKCLERKSAVVFVTAGRRRAARPMGRLSHES